MHARALRTHARSRARSVRLGPPRRDAAEGRADQAADRVAVRAAPGAAPPAATARAGGIARSHTGASARAARRRRRVEGTRAPPRRGAARDLAREIEVKRARAAQPRVDEREPHVVRIDRKPGEQALDLATEQADRGVRADGGLSLDHDARAEVVAVVAVIERDLNVAA